MSTIREQIIEAAVAFLNAGTPAGVPQCVRTQMAPTETSQLPALTCFPFREEIDPKPTGKWGPLIKRSLYLRFVTYNLGEPADRALDATLVWLSSLGGQQFGGLALDTYEHELNWMYDEGNAQVAGVGVDFVIEYQTLRADATATQ